MYCEQLENGCWCGMCSFSDFYFYFIYLFFYSFCSVYFSAVVHGFLDKIKCVVLMRNQLMCTACLSFVLQMALLDQFIFS